MTRQELSRLYWLQRDIEREQQQLSELRARLTPGAARLTGMPHTQNTGDPVGEAAAEIADLARLIELHLRQSRREYARLTGYIQTVDDPRMRMLLYLRYVCGMNWRQVARAAGGGNTEDGVKKAVYRFLQSA